MCVYGVELAVCVIGNVGGNQSNKGFKQGKLSYTKPKQNTTHVTSQKQFMGKEKRYVSLKFHSSV